MATFLAAKLPILEKVGLFGPRLFAFGTTDRPPSADRPTRAKDSAESLADRRPQTAG